ncbi:MAG: glycosyltransferase [Bacteroidetes bacterium]|nr:glycosyltransferase [Bacteroidota bacterium]
MIPYISISFVIAYAILMLVYRRGWSAQPVFEIEQGFTPKTKISIVIPACNEEQNIGKCLQSIIAQDYPKHLFEVIVVDDHSTDNTAGVVQAFNNPYIKSVKLADVISPDEKTVAYKKLALSKAIAISNGELIITTDADCVAPQNWLKNIAALYEEIKPAMIVAPVDFTSNGSVVQMFQSLDFMSMQGITAASHKLGLGNMSNGANLAFTREVYDRVGGYKGIDNLASGDDYLLMMKIKQAYPDGIAYLKSQEVIVRTAPQPDWSNFLQQRIRWASKSGKYNDKRLTAILLLVYLFNLSILLLTIYALFVPGHWLLVLVALVVKTITELDYLYPVARFFKKEKQLIIFPFLQPLHIIYIVLAGFLGFIGVYKWKGRKVK